MMNQQCNICMAYFSGNEQICSYCGTPRGMASAAQMNQPFGQTAQVGPQCSICGAYFTGDEQACLRCNTPRSYSAMNPAQFNNADDPLLMGAALGGGYFTPRRIRRRIIGRLIVWAILLAVLLLIAIPFFIGFFQGLTGH